MRIHQTLTACLVVSASILLLAPLGILNVSERGSLNLATAFCLSFIIFIFFAQNQHIDEPEQRHKLDSMVFAILASLCLSTLIAFINIPFHSDDFSFIRQTYISIGPWVTPGGDGFYRPVGYTIMTVAAKILPPTAIAWGTWNLLSYVCLSTISGIFTFLLFRTADTEKQTSKMIGMWTGLLFLVHPSHPEASTWTAGRFDVFATLFIFLGLISSLHWIRTKTFIFFFFSLISMSAAITTKEIAYSYPLLLLSVLLFIRIDKKRLMILFLSHSLIAFLLILFRLYIFSGPGGYIDSLHGTSEIYSISALGIFKSFMFKVPPVLLIPINWSAPLSLGITTLLALGLFSYIKMAINGAFSTSTTLLSLSWCIFGAAPALTQLLIGYNLEKSRVLFLSSYGICLLLASMLVAVKTASTRSILSSCVIAMFLGILIHNLSIRREVATIVLNACEDAGRIARASQSPVLFSRLPGSIHGIYAFANGFPQCVAHSSGRPENTIQVSPNSEYDPYPPHQEIWEWNSQLCSFRRIE